MFAKMLGHTSVWTQEKMRTFLPAWFPNSAHEESSTVLDWNKPINKDMYRRLWTAVIDGNQNQVLAIVSFDPVCLFAPSTEEVQGLFGRKFAAGTTPLEVLLWSFDPMLMSKQGLFEAFAKNPILLAKLFEHRHAYFDKEGLMTKTIDSGWAREMFFSFDKIVESLTLCIRTYDRKNLEISKENLLALNQALRDLPIWVAQYICFEPKLGSADNFCLHIDNRKAPFLLSGTVVLLWSKLFENVDKKEMILHGIFWEANNLSSRCGLVEPFNGNNEILYETTLASFQQLKTLYDTLVLRFINSNPNTFTQYSLSKGMEYICSYRLIQMMTSPLKTCRRKPERTESKCLRSVHPKEEIKFLTLAEIEEAAQIALDSEDAALAMFSEKKDCLKNKLQDMTDKGIFGETITPFPSLRAKTKKYTEYSSIEEIIRQARERYNATRYVCMELGWMNGDGELLSKAPEVVKTTYAYQEEALQPSF